MEGGQKINTASRNTNSVNATSGVPEDAAVFVCPVAKMVRQLLSEVADIKKQVAIPASIQSATLDNADLMKEYHISRTTAAEWRAAGLAYTKVGNKLYYKQGDISAFLEKHKHRAF